MGCTELFVCTLLSTLSGGQGLVLQGAECKSKAAQSSGKGTSSGVRKSVLRRLSKCGNTGKSNTLYELQFINVQMDIQVP